MIGTRLRALAALLLLASTGACAVDEGPAGAEAGASGARYATVSAALVATSSQCYAVADDTDSLYLLQRGDSEPTTNTRLIGATGLTGMGAISFDAANADLYAADGAQLGTLNVDSGRFTASRFPFGTGLGALGVRTFDDVDGLAWDPVTGTLWASDHDTVAGDVLFQVDPNVGRFVPGAFGTGIDYVAVPSLGGARHVLDLAFDPRDGRLYLILDGDGGARLASYRPATGDFSDIGSTAVGLRALSFDAGGGLWGTAGDSGVLYRVDVSTAGASGGIPLGGALDFEGLACLVVPSADLSVRMSATPADPGPLDFVEIGVVVSNDGPMDAPGVTLTIPVPDTTSFGSAAASQGTFAARGEVWSIGTLPTGGDASLSLFLSVNPGTVGRTIVVASDPIAASAVDPDPGDNRASASFTVSATGPGGASPIAEDDAVTTDEDTPITIRVLDNDSDPEGAALSLVSISVPTLGTAEVAGDAILFTPPPEESGVSSFRYTVRDPGGNIATASVTVTVLSVPDAPTVVDDVAATVEDAPVFIDVLANDSDADGEFIYVIRTDASAGATAAVQPDGRVRYAPAPDFAGVDQFTYTVTDPTAREATGTVTVEVTGVDDPPRARDDGFVVPADSGATDLDVLSNDVDPEGGELTLARVDAPEHGNATALSGGRVSYEPDSGFTGIDRFTYVVADEGGLEAMATVRVTVGAANLPPRVVDDVASTSPSVQIELTPLANDSDPEGAELTIAAAGPAPNGVLQLVSGDTLRYAPRGDFTGIERIPYTARDPGGLVDEGEIVVTVSVDPSAPRAYDDEVETRASEPVLITVLSNDSTPNGNLRLVDLGGPRGGTASIDGNAVRYAPRAGFVGVDQFTYSAEDAALLRVTASVIVRVRGGSPVVNTPPVARDDAVETDEDTPIVIDVLANDADFDGDPLTLTSFVSPRLGVVTAVGSELRYAPFPDIAGEDSFGYTVADGRGGSDSATVLVTVLPVNDAPVAVDDRATTELGRAVAIEVLRNDRDAEGDELSIVSTGEAENGSVSVGFAGTVLYTPDSDFSGIDQLTYRISDGSDDASAVIRIDVGAGVDSDGDGLSDDEEALVGTDPEDGDSDDDGILDGTELAYDEDLDGDGLIGALDPDSDGDGVFDGTESGLLRPDRDTADGSAVFVPDADPNTTTDPLAADSDGGGVRDGAEDTNHNGRVDVGELDPNDASDDVMPEDGDGDGLPDGEELLAGTDPDDADSDDDGVVDGAEPNWNVDSDGDGQRNALDPDSDDDAVLDGTELGVTEAGEGTELAAGAFVADVDPTTTTSALLADSDRGGREDGVEDANQNGAVDEGETDPNDPDDDFDTVAPDLGGDAGDVGGGADVAVRADGGFAGGAGCAAAGSGAPRGAAPVALLVFAGVLALVRRRRSPRASRP